MADTKRGADLVVEALSAAGVERIFTLSGNQIMPLFDACIEPGVELVHVRHEAAAVHMADCWGRLTGEPGVALVTAGPGMANALSALYVALMAESPMILLSGHAPRGQAELGAFQEMAQSEMAGPVSKASWTSSQASQLGHDVARAFKLARSGRPGPVHVSLPFDLLQAPLEDTGRLAPAPREFEREAGAAIGDPSNRRILDALEGAKRPMIVAGPAMMRGAAPEGLSSLADSTASPVISMESPRGINDPSLGALSEVLSEADLLVLLGKKLDFTLQFGGPPGISPDCRFIQVDEEESVLQRTRRLLDGSQRLIAAQRADPVAAARDLARWAARREWPDDGWRRRVEEAVQYRPEAWKKQKSPEDGPLHAIEVCRAVQELLDEDEEAVLISDGGEFGQWAQACISAPHRVINGTAGSIGSAVPFALAARLAFPASRIVTILGDGTFGFHPAEFDTAVRNDLPFVAVVGNDAAWNAEFQIQLRDYGEGRLVGCELLPSRYDRMVEAIGAYGEMVSRPSEMRPALQRAMASGRPACVNVAIQRAAAPVVRRGASGGESAPSGHTGH